MHTDDEGFLVIAAVENADMPTIRQALRAAPQIIVVEVLGGGRLEGRNLSALRVDAGHDVLDGAIFAGGVHGLKDQQHTPFVLRVEFVLQLR